MAPLDEKGIISVCHFSYYLEGNCIDLVQTRTHIKEETFLLTNRLYIELNNNNSESMFTFHCSCTQGQILSRQNCCSGY